ncbi:cyclic pyranopterin monophosphate synthase MoaC [Phragmitibacter flavus]|uniref:Cyclic pyranopterin monophosphate synthase MoaC n=1 Tax=Phragmitibacter flavus TaxID=2576071 RepID=A0A5R8KFE6_9BACT|nr:cyclic pyranopterin monophosphate synthase MoaC [Phragmitibacter flavus]TLD70705.1 cyclic pyranopterin monophosphate synthase MoaC [Phragmitibacter flavus]
MSLTHINEQGKASMVDVSAKPVMAREAVARGRIQLQAATLELIRQNEIKKGDVLAVARIAGVQAAKQTANLIPLCHQLPLSKVGMDFEFEEDGISVTAVAKTAAQTGVEMEALTAVSVALLTIYDMCKAVDKAMRLDGVHLVSKTKEVIE